MSIPQVGDIWVARPQGGPPFHSWMRFVRVESVDAAHDRITIHTVERQGDEWIAAGRKSTARLSRFDGTYWNYAIVRGPHDQRHHQ